MALPTAGSLQPLAARPGATKGSFYCHFANRNALLTAALERWEQEHTEQVIAMLTPEPDPLVRLAAVLGALPSSTEHTGTYRLASTIELALQATADHPLVVPVPDRVTRRRITYLAGLFAELGFDRDEASRRGLLACTAYLGHAQLAHATAALAPTGDALTNYVDGVLALLTRGAARPRSG